MPDIRKIARSLMPGNDQAPAVEDQVDQPSASEAGAAARRTRHR